MRLFAVQSGRMTSPFLALGMLVAVLVVVAAVEGERYTLGTLFELLACGAAAAAVYMPLGGVLACCTLLTLVASTDGGTGTGAFASLLVIALAGIAGRDLLRLIVSGWMLLLLIWWTARTLKPGESLLAYSIAWSALVAASYAVGALIHAYTARSKQLMAARLADQRRGIARDLHDTVAHSLSLIVMRAEQARLRGEADPDDLQFIAATADRSIHDLRGMMALLRADEADSSRDIWQVDPVQDVLPSACERLRNAGFAPVVNADGDLESLPPSVNAALAKVVYEATTNIIKHAAPASECAVMLEITELDAELVVSSVPKKGAVVQKEGQMGVDGMRERVHALGGEFSSGPSGRRWVTQVRLPLR